MIEASHGGHTFAALLAYASRSAAPMTAQVIGLGAAVDDPHGAWHRRVDAHEQAITGPRAGEARPATRCYESSGLLQTVARGGAIWFTVEGIGTRTNVGQVLDDLWHRCPGRVRLRAGL